MITRYTIVDSQGNVVETLNSPEEAQQYVDHMRESNPHEIYTIETVQVSSIRPGLGRDPDLH
tara:strand:- start:106 stop:291 length:186 start_codon:yes stop_codon:yes gene_type:complete